MLIKCINWLKVVHISKLPFKDFTKFTKKEKLSFMRTRKHTPADNNVK